MRNLRLVAACAVLLVGATPVIAGGPCIHGDIRTQEWTAEDYSDLAPSGWVDSAADDREVRDHVAVTGAVCHVQDSFPFMVTLCGGQHSVTRQPGSMPSRDLSSDLWFWLDDRVLLVEWGIPGLPDREQVTRGRRITVCGLSRFSHEMRVWQVNPVLPCWYNETCKEGE